MNDTNGNTEALNDVAYIISDNFIALSALPGVFTVTQFFIALFQNCLPRYRLWIVGQGLDAWVRYILQLGGTHAPTLRFHFVENDTPQKPPVEQKTLEWRQFHFIDGARVQADLKLTHFREEDSLSQLFLLHAANEITAMACNEALPKGKMSIKHANLQRFQHPMPLPIKVETQFHLQQDNQRSLKSLTRFYQDYNCLAEVSLAFDLYTETETSALLQTLGHKTFESFSNRMAE